MKTERGREKERGKKEPEEVEEEEGGEGKWRNFKINR
jgi:hypothetical protein